MYFLLYKKKTIQKDVNVFLYKKNIFNVKHFKIHMHFSFDGIFFLVCSIGHHKQKIKIKLGKLIFYYKYFQTSMKNAFGISLRYLLQKRTDVVTKMVFIL